MLTKFGKFLIFGVAALCLVSCHSVAKVDKVVGQVIASDVSSQDDNSVLVLILTKGEDINKDSDPLVKIMNSLDRNITLDFDGATHSEISVGDNKVVKRTFPTGMYKIMISAAGLKFVPDKNTAKLRRNREYLLVLKRIPKGVEYK